MPHDPSGPTVPEERSGRLTAALREVAAEGRRSAPVPGAAVRRRAVTRRRTRRAALAGAGLVVAGTAVLAGTALLAPADRPARPPAATASTTAPAPPPSPDDGTAVRDISVDLTALELHAGGRTFSVSAPGMNQPFRGDTVGRVTERMRSVRFSSSPTGVVERHDWVLAFVGRRGEQHFVYGAGGTADVPGRRPSTLGLIGLRTADARWLYEHTAVGAKIVITGDGS
ncbi:L,D-transpeptidase [Streptomyces naphthomycinicus]|uniref:L,D-transpeptidase n=1 Tax=Streptomyces naphthomycinicus TaxID=2872625 RepID=UPI001CED68E0|nr:L,D-transpeptidase [Streptomyces sp. TML10]